MLISCAPSALKVPFTLLKGQKFSLVARVSILVDELQEGEKSNLPTTPKGPFEAGHASWLVNTSSSMLDLTSNINSNNKQSKEEKNNEKLVLLLGAPLHPPTHARTSVFFEDGQGQERLFFICLEGSSFYAVLVLGCQRRSGFEFFGVWC